MLPAPSLRSFLLLAQRFLVTAQLRCHPLLPSPSEEFLSLRHQLTFAASLFCLVSVTDTVRKQPSELTALPTRRGIAQAVRQLAAALRLTCTLNTMAPQAQKEARSWAAPARAAMVREDVAHTPPRMSPEPSATWIGPRGGRSGKALGRKEPCGRGLYLCPLQEKQQRMKPTKECEVTQLYCVGCWGQHQRCT